MIDRRSVLQLAAAGGFSHTVIGRSSAETLLETPRMTEGPFYPDRLPLDTDNDLLIINDSISPAVGEITYLSGTIRDLAGHPLRHAFIEIWQVDHTGSYLHSRGRSRDGHDPNFQGYGRFLTDASGRYLFRTIKPVPYPGRAPHIHVAISRNGRRLLTTQLLIQGHPMNERDGLYRGIQDRAARESLLVDFRPLADSEFGEFQANFDIVLGQTAFEDQQGRLRGGIAPAERQRGPRAKG